MDWILALAFFQLFENFFSRLMKAHLGRPRPATSLLLAGVELRGNCAGHGFIGR